ncbi:DUF1259 domain-containing protein [Bacillus cereus group sp. MYBK249-1]|uniref:DUF1259 domain-containing protein n=1 Tax=Bacillus TaxID=1386 RepID=UPI002A34DAFD|nr:DUF1259 domain-containing protein [Bacillus cereus]HDR4464979.1 DUF1259 domain-containing protein [Bacillus cereus]HDR6758771.1 DUF1259 domain-containing protein [Bacillus cereus]
MANMNTLCEQFGQILGGKHTVEDGVCSVKIKRNNLYTSIMGRNAAPNHVIGAMFSFESLAEQGNALNLGETALRQEEVYPFIFLLQQQGIIIDSLHNHWLFMNPLLMFVHFSSIENPLSFAKKYLILFNKL